MTSSADPMLATALVAPPVLLWLFLVALLAWLRRRGRVPAGCLPAVLVAGVAGNLYPVLEVAGAEPPGWLLAPCLAVTLAVGYGYMLAQLRRRRPVVNGPRPADLRDEQLRTSERFRATAARLDLATVDAVATDETETR